MKSLLLLVALAALTSGFSASIVKAPAARYSLYLGYVGYGDRLLSRVYVQKQGYPNSIQYEDVIYRGNVTTRITAIQAVEIGYTQYAYPQLIAGGIGRNNATIRIQSARNYGYNYVVDFWGH